MDACMSTAAEILSKYVFIAELDARLAPIDIEHHLLDGRFPDLNDGDAIQQLILDLIWYEL